MFGDVDDDAVSGEVVKYFVGFSSFELWDAWKRRREGAPKF